MEKKVLKKLSLNKKEIVDLNTTEMGQLRGGGVTPRTTEPYVVSDVPGKDNCLSEVVVTPPPYIPSDVPGKDNCLSEVVVTPSPLPSDIPGKDSCISEVVVTPTPM